MIGVVYGCEANVCLINPLLKGIFSNEKYKRYLKARHGAKVFLDLKKKRGFLKHS
jgi:hypothetical protein